MLKCVCVCAVLLSMQKIAKPQRRTPCTLHPDGAGRAGIVGVQYARLKDLKRAFVFRGIRTGSPLSPFLPIAYGSFTANSPPQLRTRSFIVIAVLFKAVKSGSRFRAFRLCLLLFHFVGAF